MSDVFDEILRRSGIESADKPKSELEQKMNALEEQNEMLTECILELSELLYN